MCRGCEPTGTSQKLRDLGGCKSGTDCDGNEEKVGMVRAHEKNIGNSYIGVVAKKKMEGKSEEDQGWDGERLSEGNEIMEDWREREE